jgi:Ca-activated chloride channel homolog
MRLLQQATAKYGRNSRPLLELMATEGPAYLHAAAVPEANVLKFNIERAAELQFPLAFVVPAGGTIWADHPYCVLDNAEWVSPEQAEAAALFGDYLLQREQQEATIDNFLRPADPSIALRAPLDLEHGADPRVSPATVPALPSPDAAVSAAVTDLFSLTKRPATVILILDVSLSMVGQPLRAATRATADFLGRLQRNDEVAVLIFNQNVVALSELQPASQDREALQARVLQLTPGSGTALYDAVCQATQMAAERKAAAETAGDSRLYGIVLLTDGEDTSSTLSENQMFTNCLPTSAEADGFKIFPIAFGGGADTEVLARIAAVTGGQLCAADPASIGDCYVAISAEQ